MGRRGYRTGGGEGGSWNSCSRTIGYWRRLSPAGRLNNVSVPYTAKTPSCHISGHPAGCRPATLPGAPTPHRHTEVPAAEPGAFPRLKHACPSRARGRHPASTRPLAGDRANLRRRLDSLPGLVPRAGCSRPTGCGGHRRRLPRGLRRPCHRPVPAAGHTCSIPELDGALAGHGWKDALWHKSWTAALRQPH